jgi:hypothetical protein
LILRTNVGERAKAMKKTGLKVRYVSDRTEDRFFSIYTGNFPVYIEKNAPHECTLARMEDVASDRARRKSSASGTRL